MAEGLFHKAIGHSGGCFGSPRAHLKETGGSATAVSGHDIGLAIASELGIAGQGLEAAASLRAADPAEVLQAQRASGRATGVVVDGWLLSDTADEIFRVGAHNRVPVIVGSLSNEGSTLYVGMAEPDREEFEADLRDQYGNQTGDLLAAYARELDSSTRTAGQAIAADRNFTWQMRAWARAIGETSDVYLYFFSHAPPVFRLYLPDRPQLDYPAGRRGAGAYHSGDLAYAFGNVGLVGLDWNARDYELSIQMSQYWVNFAKTGDPNGEGLPRWPQYDREGEPRLEFATYGTAATSKVREHKLDLFDPFYQSGGN